MSKLIYLYGKYGSIIGNYAEVDDSWYEKLIQYKWLARKNKTPNFVRYYAATKINNKNIFMHRMILDISDPKILVDHINGKTLSNLEDNLRICSQKENVRNSRSVNSNGFKGVVRMPSGNYRAQLGCDGKRLKTVVYKTAEEAAVAYDFLAIKAFGKFAKLNFPNNNYDNLNHPNKSRTSYTGYKNIQFNKLRKKYCVRIIKDGILYSRTFSNLQEAINCRDEFEEGFKNAMQIKDLKGNIHIWNLKGYEISKIDTRIKSEGHKYIRTLLQEIFPFDLILEEVYVPGEKLFLDFFIPCRKLIIEFNGLQHDKYIPFFHKTKKAFLESKKRDIRKQEWSKLNGFSLLILKEEDDEKIWKKQIMENS